MLEAKKLNKAVVPESLIQYPSPGSFQSTRLAVHANGDSPSCWVYIASGSRVYKLHISMEDSLVDRGKESLLIPKPVHVLESSCLKQCTHQSEIQSILLTGTEDSSILGSVDSYGHLIVSKLNASNRDVDGFLYSASPRDSGVGEGSWAGLSFNPTQLYMAAVARSFCKSVDVYDQDICLRTLHTLWHPNSLTFLNNSIHSQCSMLAIAEGSQLSIWDMRVKENGGCMHRVTASTGDFLYAISVSSCDYIAVGGADRNVTIYDPRKWSVLSRWMNCSKYEVTGLAFSSVDPNYIYVQGVDYEVLCGDWRGNMKAFSFRGDSNWLGFSKSSNRDVVAGWSDSGSIFMADVSVRSPNSTTVVSVY